jgi:hypothetical protein
MSLPIPPITVDRDALAPGPNRYEFDRVGFELIARAGRLCEHVVDQTGLRPDGTRQPLAIDEATLGGLLVRMSKLLRDMFASTQADESEAHQILARCAVETAINLRWLIRKADPAEYKRFRAASFATLLQWLEETAAAPTAGSPVAVDGAAVRNRMEQYIEAELALAGLTRADVPASATAWGAGNFRNRLVDLELEELYLPMFATHSYYVHGSWHEIRTFHLERDQSGFHLDSSFGGIGPPTSYETAIRCMEAARDYCEVMPVADIDEDELVALVDRSEDLVGQMNVAFQRWLAAGGLDVLLEAGEGLP